MADRNRRVRRQISDVTEELSSEAESDSGDDWGAPSSGSKRRSGKSEPVPANPSRSPTVSRTKRTTATASVTSTGSSATVYKSTSPEDRRQSIRLTVKVPPSKLREVMRANEIASLRDTLGGGQVLEGSRSRRAAANTAPRTTGRRSEKPRYTEYGESDIEDEDENENEEEDEDVDGDGDNSDRKPNILKGIVEPEGDTDEEEVEDIEMEDAPLTPEPLPTRKAMPKPPKITLKAPSKIDTNPPRPKLIVTPANVGPLKSVEDQEMEDDPDDEEVEESSALSGEEGEENGDENDENEEELGDEEGQDEEELDGEDEELDEEEEDDEDDSDSDSDETPASGMATPDITKLTKRQRGRPEDQGQLMALDMAPQQRKFFTDAEKAMKKDEHARKRKELTKRKVQEEKDAALNRLLKPQASKSRGAAPKPETLAAATAAASRASPAGEEEEYYEKANPLYTRWVSDVNGSRLGVPEEWLGKRVGQVFDGPMVRVVGERVWSGRLVEEID